MSDETDRYKHSVIDVSLLIHGYAKGTRSGLPKSELRKLAEWLWWRTGSEGWTEPSDAFDDAVFDLAHQALRLAEEGDE